MGRIAKFLTAGFLFMIAIVALFIFGLRSCLSKYDERAALPPAVYVQKDGNAVLFSIVQFQQTNSYSQQGGMVQRSVTDVFYVQNNDALTGKKIAAKEVELPSGKKHSPTEVLGLSGTHVWVFINGLMAFDAFTLEKVAGLQLIEEKNPSLKGRLPAERKYYEFIPGSSSIHFTAIDGSLWMLDTKTLTASAAEETRAADIPAKIEEAEKRIKEMNKTNIYFGQIKVNQDTLNGQWVGLYTGEEFRTLPERVTIAALNGEDPRRQFIISTYDTVKDYRQFVLSKDKVSFNSTAGYFLDGGFLLDKETGNVLHLHAPESRLVVYKEQIGHDGPILISRISNDGKVLWKYDTRLVQWIDWQRHGKLLYVFGSNNKALGSAQCNLLCIIDLDNGSVKGYDFFTDKEF